MTSNFNPGREPELQSHAASQAPAGSRLVRDNTHQLITEIARALVDSPEEVFVEAVERDACFAAGYRQGHRQTGPHSPLHAYHPERGEHEVSPPLYAGHCGTRR
jgi:hypothetical protein